MKLAGLGMVCFFAFPFLSWAKPPSLDQLQACFTQIHAESHRGSDFERAPRLLKEGHSPLFRKLNVFTLSDPRTDAPETIVFLERQSLGSKSIDFIFTSKMLYSADSVSSLALVDPRIDANKKYSSHSNNKNKTISVEIGYAFSSETEARFTRTVVDMLMTQERLPSQWRRALSVISIAA